MAKLNAPLFSFKASGKLAGALVYFPWKGLNVVRQYVIPSNPKSTAQTTQRGYLDDAVDAIHAAMIDATKPLGEVDRSAYSLWASLLAKPMTWFNRACKNWLDQLVAGLDGTVYRGGTLTPADEQVTIAVYSDDIGDGDITAGDFYYGTSKTALLNSEPAVITLIDDEAEAVITPLVNGTKYYFQFRPSAGAGWVGANSGIYHSTPHA
jgi:hypothetical protein